MNPEIKKPEQTKWELLADKIEKINKQFQDGEGFSNIQSIIFYLRKGDVDAAKNECNQQCDKFGSYQKKEIKNILIKELFDGKDFTIKNIQ
ncbi:hypothetical protein ACFL1Y_00175 [Patescibacteria group bacterium]